MYHSTISKQQIIQLVHAIRKLSLKMEIPDP